MERRDWIALLAAAVGQVGEWEDRWPAHALSAPDEAASAALRELGARLTRDNDPFFHPSYAGQMLKPPHPVAWAAYAAAMCVNPNNHALGDGPAAAALEREAAAPS